MIKVRVRFRINKDQFNYDQVLKFIARFLDVIYLYIY